MQRTPRELPEDGSEVYLVGDLRVDVGQQRVTRADDEIPLPNLSFRLLVALIHAAPNVISNEMLMTNVWPGLIVSPETVDKRAKLLRDVLGDDAREPRYIAGVRSRGYRLVTSVSLAADIPPAQDLPPPAPQTGDHRVEPPNADTVIAKFIVASHRHGGVSRPGRCATYTTAF
jgi:DNA-binding winged helix-turn-helix (wHTH) protein